MNDKDFSPELNKVVRLEPLSGMILPSGIRFFDNSSLDTYRVCPRKFYYRHIRNFEPTSIRIALVFGSSWHSAMDFIWANAFSFSEASLIEGGVHSFNERWAQEGISDDLGFDYYPRTPARAAQMLSLYVPQYHDLLRRYNILAIERPFIVPLTNMTDIYYVGKLDKVFEYMNYIYIVDHKTSSSFAGNWMQQFSPNGQIDGYLHAGHSSYGERFKEVIIDGALVQKTSMDFKRIPVARQINQLSSWMWEVQELIDQVEVNEERLLEYRAGGESVGFLPAFPKCTSSCTTYYGLCPYIDLCKFWDDPETKKCPDGFIEDKWEPFHIEEKDGDFQVQITNGD